MGSRLILVLAALLPLGWGLLHAQGGDLDAYTSRGRELSKAGKIDQALPYFMLALELAEASHGADGPALVPVLENLADAHAAIGNYRDAEPLYRRALTIQEREAARYQAGIARTLNSLGNIYEATDRGEEALEMYRQVLTAWAPVLGASHPEVQTASDRFAKLALQGPVTPPAAPASPGAAKTGPAKTGPAKTVPPPEVADAPPATPPSTPPAAGAGFAVHLTSIRDPRDAAAEWARLRRLYGPLLADLDLVVARVDLGPGRGVYYRVKGGILDRAAARARCAAFAARKVWCNVTRAGAGAAPGGPAVAARAGAPSPAPSPAPSSAPSGLADPDAAMARGYRIHLTSIRDPKDAEAEWQRLRHIYGSLLDGLSLTVVRVDLGAPKGIYYRVLGGPLTRESARALCARFAARKVWCRVARPGEDAALGARRLAVRQVRRRPPSRRRGTRRTRDSVYLRIRFRDRGCRRSPFARPVPALGSRRWTR